MGQCKKTMDNGERCSNRAIPGTDYCEHHKSGAPRRRFTFRRIEPAAPPEEPKKGAPRTPAWVARPWAPDADPAFPGLKPDARGVLTASEGLIRLSAGEEKKVGKPFQRLARVLSALSRAMPLAGRITIKEYDGGDAFLLRIAPAPDEGADPSRLSDTMAAAAEMGVGEFFIGGGRAFIQYRDDRAPRGYDAADVTVPGGEDLYLVDETGTWTIPASGGRDTEMNDLLLRMPTVPLRNPEPPDTAWVLAEDRALVLLARYFRAHHLRHELARIRDSAGRARVLFRLLPVPEAPTGTQIPRFVMAWLSALPRCAVMTETEAEAGRRVLTAWGRRHPCRGLSENFPPESLVLFPDDPDFTGMCVTPAPDFFDGDALLDIDSEAPTPVTFTADPDPKARSVVIPFRLVPSTGPCPFPAAVILDEKETEWLRRLVHRMPENHFHRYGLCRGRKWSVLIGRETPIDRIPFGIPLRSVKGTRLFIPIGSRLTPDLDWSLLARVLDIQEGTDTFLTEQFRLDVPETAFTPLSRALVAEPDRPRVSLELQTTPDLPILQWSPPPKKEEPKPRRILPSDQTGSKTKGGEKKSAGDGPMGGGNAIRRRAVRFQEDRDFLSAGVCYTLIEDRRNAARCFRYAAAVVDEDTE